MRWFRLDHLLDYLSSGGFLFGLLWLGLAALTVALLVLMRTRWGQSRPLGKCLALSLLVHLLLAGYATTIEIVGSTAELADEQVLQVSVEEHSQGQDRPVSDPAYQEKPWDAVAADRVTQPRPVDLARPETSQMPEPTRREVSEPDAPPADPSLVLPLANAVESKPQGIVDDARPQQPTVTSAAQKIDAPKAQRREAARTLGPVGPGPQRDPVAGGSDASPTRQRRSGLPESLFQPPSPLPRMTGEPTTPTPEDSLRGLADAAHRPELAKPAPAVTGPTGAAAGSAAAPDAAGEGTAGPTGRLSPPSLSALAGKHPSDTEAGVLPRSGLPELGPPLLARRGSGQPPAEMPEIYKLRVAPDRAKLAEKHGATAQTEEAVKAALKWLAANQEADGRWDAQHHGAGRELMVAGRDRKAAGIHADTGVTGLALLAFLASGHTHLEGDYQANVRRGLEYLLRQQASDGNVGGQATTYAFMYCHAMATFALSEAYAMTKDEQLRGPVRRAVGYTLAAQDPTSGGWRYKPRDPGDTSQLGWQLMALKSAALGGIPIPTSTQQGIHRFLNSASSGRYGGLVAYRPSERPSRPMTAEALVCRQFLGVPRTSPASREAADYLLGELPGQAEANLYYWYYATLGMYQMQGAHWRQWNDALQSTLLGRQQKTGPLAGSWNPDTRWAGYGGRVYSTALAALCLEVPYRFLPLYSETPSGANPLR